MVGPIHWIDCTVLPFFYLTYGSFGASHGRVLYLRVRSARPVSPETEHGVHRKLFGLVVLLCRTLELSQISGLLLERQTVPQVVESASVCN